jgi:hypothetical protein
MPVPDEIKTSLLIGTAHLCLPTIRKHIELIEQESEVVPGIRLLPAPSHTPGLSLVKTRSD